METGNDHNPILLNLENYSVKEAPTSRATPVTVDHRETQRVFLECFGTQPADSADYESLASSLLGIPLKRGADLLCLHERHAHSGWVVDAAVRRGSRTEAIVQCLKSETRVILRFDSGSLAVEERARIGVTEIREEESQEKVAALAISARPAKRQRRFTLEGYIRCHLQENRLRMPSSRVPALQVISRHTMPRKIGKISMTGSLRGSQAKRSSVTISTPSPIIY